MPRLCRELQSHSGLWRNNAPTRLEYAQLLKGDVPAAPIYSGLDGGMNKVFLARFPGRVTLSKVQPYASYLPQLPPIPWVDNDGSLTSRWFGTLFSKPIGCDLARTSFLSSVLAGHRC